MCSYTSILPIEKWILNHIIHDIHTLIFALFYYYSWWIDWNHASICFLTVSNTSYDWAAQCPETINVCMHIKIIIMPPLQLLDA